MTAPDDVRARFELVMVSAVSPQNNAPYGTFPSYEQAEAVAKLLLKADAEDSPEWCGYLIDRAAHADLSGEVRELVDADREYDEAQKAYGDSITKDTEVTRRAWVRLAKACERRAAAIAKFNAHLTQPAQAVDVETYKAMLDESHEHHLACIKDAYRLLGIDESDGEYRYKWVALEIAKLTAALAKFTQEKS